MTVKTIPGVLYVLSAPSACSVSSSSGITLCALASAGQKTFQAISLSVEVSNPDATILPFANAASLSIGQDGGSSSAEMTELLKSYATKTDVSSAVNQHAGDSSLHMNTQEREALTNLVQNPPHDGKDGKDGKDGADGAPGAPGADGEDGAPGADGKSAYQIWLDNGHSGTEQQFLASLKGEKGEPGEAAAKGDKGDPGADGKSAYQIWLDNGHEGDETLFLASLKGEKGEDGKDGAPGEPGADGQPGKDGAAGAKGDKGNNGVTFTPSLAQDGTLSWTNDGKLPNPDPVNIKGEKGAPGEGIDFPYYYDYKKNCLAIGSHAISMKPTKSECYAFGTAAFAAGESSYVIGTGSSVYGTNSYVFGSGCHISESVQNSFALGIEVKLAESDTMVLSCTSTEGNRTQLYLVPEGSELSTRCCGGKAALGFTVDNGVSLKPEILKSGWVALEDLCTNPDFTPKLTE